MKELVGKTWRPAISEGGERQWHTHDDDDEEEDQILSLRQRGKIKPNTRDGRQRPRLSRCSQTHTHTHTKESRAIEEALHSYFLAISSFSLGDWAHEKKKKGEILFFSLFWKWGKKSQGEQQSVRCERCEDVGGRRHVDAIAEPDRSRTWSSTAIQTDGCVRRVCAIEANLTLSSPLNSFFFLFHPAMEEADLSAPRWTIWNLNVVYAQDFPATRIRPQNKREQLSSSACVRVNRRRWILSVEK